jgi:hypothetical protein
MEVANDTRSLAGTQPNSQHGVGARGLIGLLSAEESERPATAADEADRPHWGTKDRILTHVGFNEFAPMAVGTGYAVYADGTYGLFASPNPANFAAIAHVPSGAFVMYYELDYCDTNVDKDVSVQLAACNYLGTTCDFLAALSSGDGASGCHFVSQDIAFRNFTMNNNSKELVLQAQLQSGDSTTRLLGVYIGYRLQIGEAPSTATFGDVPTTHPYFRAIEALAASGITGGCGNGNYCPNQNVTRAEMAAFLARALGLHFPN